MAVYPTKFCRQKSIRDDVNVIRYKYETRNADEAVWIPGRVTLASSGTKTDSPKSTALKLTLSCGKISFDLFKHRAGPPTGRLGSSLEERE